MDNTNAATAFGEKLYAKHLSASIACRDAQALANANECPVMILQRDGWLAIIEEAPDDAECDPYGHGWSDYALIAPEVR